MLRACRLPPLPVFLRSCRAVLHKPIAKLQVVNTDVWQGGKWLTTKRTVVLCYNKENRNKGQVSKSKPGAGCRGQVARQVANNTDGRSRNLSF